MRFKHNMVIIIFLSISCFSQLFYAQSHSSTNGGLKKDSPADTTTHKTNTGGATIKNVSFIDSLHIVAQNYSSIKSICKADSGKQWCIVDIKFSGSLDSEWVSTEGIMLIDASGGVHAVLGVRFSDENFTLIRTATYLLKGGTLVFAPPKDIAIVALDGPKFGRIAIPAADKLKSKKEGTVKANMYNHQKKKK